MQALLAGLANVALKYAHTVARLAAPVLSEYWSVKVWLIPDPELGVTETAAMFTVVNDQIGEPLLPAEFFASALGDGSAACAGFAWSRPEPPIFRKNNGMFMS